MKLTRSFLMAGLAASAVLSTGAFAHIKPGMHLRKDDAKTAEQMLAALSKDMGDISTALSKSKQEMETKYTELTTQFGGVEKKLMSDEDRALLKKMSDEYAELVSGTQALTQALDDVKKELNAPLIQGGKDLADNDRKAAIELQRRAFIHKHGNEDDFKADLDNLVKAADLRSAAQKMMKVGLITKQEAIRSLTQDERKAFDAASMDSAFFAPEMLGIEVDCNIECASLLDLYGNVAVSRSTFMFPQIVDYGAIGQYSCDAVCNAELGPEGNIRWMNGKTFDWRGVFCFQKKVLQEANYPILEFMFRAAERSHRINRNRALITGDGINEPLGWLTGDCFTKIATPEGQFNHQDFRRFFASAPIEYGPIIATMHQNVFAYLASAVDTSGRFIFGDGLMTYSPDDVRERLRISNCLPDPTNGGTLGGEGTPFVAGSFIAAAGNWEMAYSSVSRKPMFMEQYIGGTTAWCVQYQFGAEEGGFVKCCPAARTLVAG